PIEAQSLGRELNALLGDPKARAVLSADEGDDRERGYKDRKKEITQYFRAVDRTLWPILRDEHAPLVLAAVGYLHPLFREACRYPHVLEEGIVGNADGMSLDRLREAAWRLVASYENNLEAELLGQFACALKAGRASHDLGEIAKAVTHGRVRVLLHEAGRIIWGHVDTDTGEVAVHEKQEQQNTEDADIIDDLCELTLAQGRSGLRDCECRPDARLPDRRDLSLLRPATVRTQTPHPRAPGTVKARARCSPAPVERRWSTATVLAAALAMIGAIGLLDHVTRIELRAYPLYVAPVALVAWRLGLPMDGANHRGGNLVGAASITAGHGTTPTPAARRRGLPGDQPDGRGALLAQADAGDAGRGGRLAGVCGRALRQHPPAGRAPDGGWHRCSAGSAPDGGWHRCSAGTAVRHRCSGAPDGGWHRCSAGRTPVPRWGRQCDLPARQLPPVSLPAGALLRLQRLSKAAPMALAGGWH
ncbi:MAG: hypothetical protein IPG96_21450, partial [Proteobacteria bacterium]|nr:hypothetical protein [Pseudomonadota bacterium]